MDLEVGAAGVCITIDHRLHFPDSKSLSGYWMVFPAGGATTIDSFEHVD